MSRHIHSTNIHRGDDEVGDGVSRGWEWGRQFIGLALVWLKP